MLIFELSERQQLAVGRLGVLLFVPAFYIYVGSAFGPGGVRGRMRHHLRPSPRPHWHVDYLKGVAKLLEVWVAYDVVKRECQWATLWGKIAGISVPFPHFGASDCGCESHLFFSDTQPDFEDYQGRFVGWIKRIV